MIMCQQLRQTGAVLSEAVLSFIENVISLQEVYQFASDNLFANVDGVGCQDYLLVCTGLRTLWRPSVYWCYYSSFKDIW